MRAGWCGAETGTGSSATKVRTDFGHVDRMRITSEGLQEVDAPKPERVAVTVEVPPCERISVQSVRVSDMRQFERSRTATCGYHSRAWPARLSR